MKRLFSQLTLVMLSLLIFLLTVAKKSESRKTRSGNEIRTMQPVEQESATALTRTEQDSLIEEPSFMSLPLKEGILTGKRMYLLIY